MSYVSEVNALIRARLEAVPGAIVYGQNIDAGSCLSGLTRGLSAGADGKVLNTPNAENTLVGAGFGLTLRGRNAIFFMKQHDFLLLALDQVVNTWNVLRLRPAVASFTIVAIVVDSGFEGPQSCLNNLGDFCSLAHIPGYVITNRWDAAAIVDRHLIAPGFRLISVSQRLFSQDMPTTDDTPTSSDDGAFLRYAAGDAATIVAFNFAFPEALKLWRALAAKGIRASLFSVPAVLPEGWADVSADATRTGRLIVLDDSKSVNRASDRLLLECLKRKPGSLRTALVRRDFTVASLHPNADRMPIDIDAIMSDVGL